MRGNDTRRGAVLPMVILIMVVLSVLIAAGIATAGSEARVNANQQSNVDAFALAENGLELFLVKRDSFGFVTVPPAASESTRVTYTTGYADVVLTRIRNDAVNGRYSYVVRSHGVNTQATLSGTAQAERSVAEYAVWKTSQLSVLAGWTSLTGLQKNGNSGALTGDDGCNPADTVAGVAVPTSPGYSGPSGPVSGNPPVRDLGTQGHADSAVGIDWNGIVNGGALTPDIVIPGGSWPASFPANYWPVIYVVGNYTLPGAGQGTLIVTGDLTISGSRQWNGIVMAGGNLTSNGNNTVEGTVISGLNVLLGQTVAQASIGNGTKTYQYNSCNIASAMSHTAHLVGYSNSWVDNWPTY
ncbi:MAG TPA: pilus assembly PilX N-terminal domain-containing protein [Gemmatimonadales bacterium]|nr:pilus assembly PilX N-terminal domain-containing protein [Gemmatimonadales bacterium]